MKTQKGSPLLTSNRESSPPTSSSTAETKRSYVILLGTFVFLAAWNVVVVLLDDSVIGTDEAGYYATSLSLARGSQNLLSPSWRPPLSSVAAVPWYYVFGFSRTVAQLSELPFLLWLMLVTYGLGSRLFGESPGRLAGVLIGLFPLTIGMSRVYMADIPCAALVTQGILLLVKGTQSGSHGGARPFLGGALFLALSSLVRVAAPVYWIVPAAWIACEFLRRASHRTDLRLRARQLATAAVLGACVLGIYYIPNAFTIWSLYRTPGHNLDPGTHLPVFSLASLLWYAKSMFRIGTGPVLIALFALAGILLTAKRALPRITLPVVWLLGSYVILTLIPGKFDRFFLPALPAAALILAAGVSILELESIRRVLGRAAVATAIGQLIALDILFPPRPDAVDPPSVAFEHSNNVQHFGLFSWSGRPWTDEDLEGLYDTLTSSSRQEASAEKPILLLAALSPANPVRLDAGRWILETGRPVMLLSLVEWRDQTVRVDEKRSFSTICAISYPAAPEAIIPIGHQAYVDLESWKIWNKIRARFALIATVSLLRDDRLEVFEAQGDWQALRDLLDRASESSGTVLR